MSNQVKIETIDGSPVPEELRKQIQDLVENSQWDVAPTRVWLPSLDEYNKPKEIPHETK